MVMPCDPQEPRLPKPLERFQIDSQLSQDAKEQRRANRAAAMDRNRGSSAVLVAPPLVTAGLACSLDPKSCGKALELGGAGTRHVRFRWSRAAAFFRSYDVPLRSTQTPWRVL
jgi:hypothetical protein